MEKHLTITELRKIFKSQDLLGKSKFTILQGISNGINSFERTALQEIVLRLLARRGDFIDYDQLVSAIVREIGLFPYLDQDSLSLPDMIAYEFHKPEGLDANIVFHQVQAKVYHKLLDGKNIILSAPTSFGKSLIIDAIIASNSFLNLAIIVPTIALIDETRRRLSKFRDKYKIITHSSQVIESKNIFILTQERAIEFLDPETIDFFVIDEFYKISPSGGNEDRSYLLNQVFYKLLKASAQFYLLGPNIERISEDSFPSEVEFDFVKTDYQTVISERINVPFEKKQENEALIELCSKLKEPTLIFCKSPASAHRVAKALRNGLQSENLGTNTDIVNWLQDEYHPDWLLPAAIEKGIGIHHGKIPRAIAQFCVRAFNEGKLNFLVCTSTLIEGVNTKAKNVIIFDNKIATKKFDFFTFNNIAGRSGRMFQYFIGNVYLFHSPPTSELPFVDFPILSQAESLPERVLLQIEQEDLTSESKQRLLKYYDQDLLSIETLKSNSNIDLESQLALAGELIEGRNSYPYNLNWKRFPSNDQLYFACDLIWRFFVKSRARIKGVSSGKQLAFKVQQFSHLKTARRLIEHETKGISDFDDINDKIDHTLDFLKYWCNFNFPRYLMSLSKIQADVYGRLNLPFGDYSTYATAVESSFSDRTFMALDEYGIPIQVSKKMTRQLQPDGVLDDVLERLRNLDIDKVSGLKLTEFEKSFVREVQKDL